VVVSVPSTRDYSHLAGVPKNLNALPSGYAALLDYCTTVTVLLNAGQ
jgi:hypothetical protein